MVNGERCCIGYPMAKNLRSKIPSSDTMIIHDVNPAVTDSFAKEMGNVTVAQSVREVAENSVRGASLRRAAYLSPPAQSLIL
jgi:hypothetical protein